MLEDLQYAEKQALIEFKMEPEVYERQNYYRFNEILLAESRENREQDIMSLIMGNNS
nr:hypothetical protein [uncultured Ligilactobacillus sp.]